MKRKLHVLVMLGSSAAMLAMSSTSHAQTLATFTKDKSEGRQAELTVRLANVNSSSDQLSDPEGGGVTENEHNDWVDIVVLSPPINEPGYPSASKSQEISFAGVVWSQQKGRALKSDGKMGPLTTGRIDSSGGPGRVRIAARLSDCSAGRRFVTLSLGQSGKGYATLSNLETTSCDRNATTFDYGAIEFRVPK